MGTLITPREKRSSYPHEEITYHKKCLQGLETFEKGIETIRKMDTIKNEDMENLELQEVKK